VEECTYFWGVNTSWGIDTAEIKDLCIRKIIRLHNQQPEQQRSNPELVETSSQEKEKDQAEDPREPEKALAMKEGEISTGSSSEEDSSNELTPKKPRRGRKSKIVEREKETYKDVLNGSQPKIKQLINVRQTRKKSKAFQGGHNSPSGNQ
jgi:hypothetical protein